MLRALTLWRPWPWAILRAARGKRKLIENRDWSLPKALIGVPILIHAGKKWDAEGARFIQELLGLVGLPPAAWDEGLVGQMVVDSVLSKARGDVAPSGQERWFFGDYGFLLNDEQTYPIEPDSLQGRDGAVEGAGRG
jgi:hypothetical protein